MLSIISFYIFLTSLTLCTILVPFMSRLSNRIGGIDTPDERKIHTHSVTRLGGIAIFGSLLFTIIFFCDINQQLKGFLSGFIVIFLTGLADDLTNISPRQKFAGEFLAAGLAVFMGGIVVRHLGTPFGLGTLELGPLAVPFTIIGIVGLINAINLLDGMDGLAGGVCTIATVSFAIISHASGNQTLFPLTVALLGSLLGFLRFNNYPASIFMGDSGSLLLGYCMGTFSIMLAGGGILPVSPYLPLMILGVPILDTLVVMTNRKRNGKPLFQPDKTHLHHRLLGMGVGHKMTVLIVFGVTYLLNMIAVLGCNLNGFKLLALSDTSLLLLLTAVTAAVYGVMYFLSSREKNLAPDLSCNKSLRSTALYRRLIRLSGILMKLIKALVIAVLLMPLFFARNEINALPVVPFVLLILSTLFVYLAGRRWRQALLQWYLYPSGAFIIFILVNYGRNRFLLGIPLIYISHLLFLLLFICIGAKVLIRRRIPRLIVSPVEYLILLIVLTIPLLPYSFAERYHLLTVAAKSVILFTGFKLVLMRQQRRNRKLILAIALTSLILVFRYALDL